MNLLEWTLRSSAETVSSIDPAGIQAVADALVTVFSNGGRAVIFGNGGSAADAQHLAGEFSGRYLFDRPPLDAIALSGIAPATAIGNDYSFEEVFARQVRASVRPGDAVIGISTSGNSSNVVRAMEAARGIGAVTIAMTGSGGSLRNMVDHSIVVPSTRTPRIQEGYMVAGHMVCGLVERAMFGRPTVFVDRDDTLAKDVPYCSDPDDLELFEGVPEAVRRLNDAGFLVIMVTNQSGISRGYFDEATLDAIHDKVRAGLATAGARLDAIYRCPHLPDAGCDCRKPGIGLVLQALDDFPIDLSSSYVIGDSDMDMEMAARVGAKGIQVGDGLDFTAAVDRILG